MKEIIIAIGQTLLIGGAIIVFVLGLIWLIRNSPIDSLTLIKVKGIGTFVCREKYEWLRKDYSEVCIKWE